MKFQVEVVIKDESGQVMQRTVIFERLCVSFDDAIGGLGLSLADSKTLVANVQKQLLETQVHGFSFGDKCCPTCSEAVKRKDVQTIVYRTLFGKFTLPNERFLFCVSCGVQGKKSFSPLSDLLITHTHPELIYMQTRWAALLPFGQSLRLLEDVLPIEGAISLTNMKLKTAHVGQRIEADRTKQAELVAPPEIAQTATAAGEEQTPTALDVGVDAGYIRSNAAKGEDTRKFGAIAVKTVETKSRSHAYVQTEVADGDKRIIKFLEQGSDAPLTNVTFFTDAGNDIKAATPLVGKGSQRILDWFHFAMYFQIALQTATPFKRWQYNAVRTIFEEIERIKWRFWHGQAEAACHRLKLLATWIGSQANTKLKVKLTERLFDLLHYAQDNIDYLVNYARRHRNGQRISSAMAESVVNQVISRRFVKKQQMRWSPQGAHHLLQVRTAVLNDELAQHFKRWHPGFATNDPVYARAA